MVYQINQEYGCASLKTCRGGFLKSFFQQERYAEPLEELITAKILEKSTQFRERADYCLHQRVEHNTLLLKENNFPVRGMEHNQKEQGCYYSQTFATIFELLKDQLM